MKIVIFVDYSHEQFNKDFQLSNMLIEKGHNVFLAINQEQCEYLKKNCNVAVLGYSFNFENKSLNLLSLSKNNSIIESITMIENINKK